VVPRGEAQAYAGGTWKLTDLSKLPGTLPKTNVVLAEIEVTVTDPDQLKQATPCPPAVTDAQGRSWTAMYLSDRIVRRLKPQASGKPQCLNLIADGIDGTVQIVESFLVPEDAGELSLTLSMSGAKPGRLILK
jgi:hypothetical protein